MRQYSDWWNKFSQDYSHPVAHLGDEWGSPQPITDEFITPYVGKGDYVLEIGPGGGKYTQKLIEVAGHENVCVADCSQEMLDRVSKRFSETPVKSFLTDGKTLDAVKADRPFDVIWSYDVFTHIDLYDIVNMILQLRVMAREGVATFVIHHSDISQCFGYEHWTGLREMFDGDDSAGSFSVNSAKIMHDVLRYHGFQILDQKPVRAGRDTVTIFRS